MPMRSFDYFATFDESVSIVRDLCEQQFQIVVEPQLADRPEAQTFHTVNDELVGILERAPVFYVTGPFTRFPLQFSQLTEGTAKGKYSIDWLAQGPLIKGLASRINPVQGAQRLIPGRFSHHDAYKNPDTSEWETPTSELKAAFRQIVKIVKNRCQRFQYKPGVDVFIAPEALALLQNGKIHIVENQIVPGGGA